MVRLQSNQQKARGGQTMGLLHSRRYKRRLSPFPETPQTGGVGQCATLNSSGRSIVEFLTSLHTSLKL